MTLSNNYCYLSLELCSLQIPKKVAIMKNISGESSKMNLVRARVPVSGNRNKQDQPSISFIYSFYCLNRSSYDMMNRRSAWSSNKCSQNHGRISKIFQMRLLLTETVLPKSPNIRYSSKSPMRLNNTVQ